MYYFKINLVFRAGIKTTLPSDALYLQNNQNCNMKLTRKQNEIEAKIFSFPLVSFYYFTANLVIKITV